jgi:ribosomal protein S18 acetylase RimI-like enzyme
VPSLHLSQDDPRLENPVYAALSGAQSRFAWRRGRALRYEPDVAPFLALPPEPAEEDWANAIELVPPGTAAATVEDGSPLPGALTVSHRFELVQMVGSDAEGADSSELVDLDAADVPEMMELVRRTEPGPFMHRTIELGRYIGIRRDGVLAAMAGERMRFEGWTEISAVCTAPERRGNGLASVLVSVLVGDARRRREEPFLHVMKDNTGAIRLYEALGFHIRRTSAISLLTRAAAA